jgi:hypothetical protein|tara:strand:- start:4632 stop:5771 length:1140 start_codon:yes stop_codon:yes gene_type:complete
MAVLGTNGRVILNRSAPTPVVVDVTDLNQDKNIISLTAQGFRSGDLVEVASIDNWPNVDLADPPLIPTYANVYDYQDYPELVGYSTAYPSELLRPYRWLATESNDALTTESGDIIAVQSDADTTPYRNRLYVNVDQLNRLSFYRTRAAALAGANDVTRETIDQSVFTLDPTAPIELRLVNEWKLQACLQSWELSLSGNEIDTTGLGDQFFDGVKSLIQGGGTFDFLIEREARDTRNTAIISRSEHANAYVFYDVPTTETYNEASVVGSSAGVTAYDNANITPAPAEFTYDTKQLAGVGTSNLLRLLLNTNEQTEAEAEFWMIDGDLQDRTSYTGSLLPGDLYYKAQVMLTSSAVSVRATDIITGSANFVTVREVQLREG